MFAPPTAIYTHGPGLTILKREKKTTLTLFTAKALTMLIMWNATGNFV
jgi:hypothetical protein